MVLRVALFPFLLLYLLVRVIRNHQYADHLAERFGLLSPSFHRTVPGSIWLHAVSVGEVMAALPLIRRIRRDRPQWPIFISCGTLAGRAMAEQKLAAEVDGIFYVPIDYGWAVRRVLRALKPALVIILETEIWPTLMREARRAGARVLTVNARISDRAFPSYWRWRWIFASVLQSVDLVLAQDAIAEQRYRQLGAPRVEVAGNLKYDFDPDATRIAPEVAAFLSRTAPEAIWLAASTMPPREAGDIDEDDLVLDTFQELAQKHPRLLLILVPRRPERFPEAAAKLSARQIPFVRRSELNASSALALPGVLLIDTIGELAGLFRVATVVFMGGSMARRGGHNILEPAAFGVPVVVGPHNENFTAIAEEFLARGGAVQTEGGSFASTLSEFITDADRRQRIGEVARQLSEAQRGAARRATTSVLALYEQALPRPPQPWLLRTAFTPLQWLWTAGVQLDKAMKTPRRLDGATVISVGNLAMGGTGKTPFVQMLSRRLSEQGHSVAILTRGYGRTDASRPITLLPGDTAPVSVTGEEAQLFLRDGVAALGIGSNRATAYTLLRERMHPNIVLLDDGFQHWALQREHDIVLIDALDPLRDGVFPLGRLREDFSALQRATVIVLTKTEPGRTYSALVDLIRKHNHTAPLWRVRSVASVPPVPPGRLAAFCGLGQPEAFRQTLADFERESGRSLVWFRSVGDHHHYTEAELNSMASQADVLLTTEKDMANVPQAWAATHAIFAVTIRFELETETDFLRWGASLPKPTSGA